MMDKDTVAQQYQLLQQNIAEDDEIPMEAKTLLAIGLGLLEDIHLKLTKISEK